MHPFAIASFATAMFGITRAADCERPGRYNVDGDLSRSLSNAIRTETLKLDDGKGWPYPIDHLHYFAATWGDIRVCAYNNFVFENTHLPSGELAWAIDHIMNECGSWGGSVDAHGDSGLTIPVYLTTANRCDILVDV